MNRRQLVTSGMVAAVVAASATPARAQAGNDQDLIGSWFGTVTATNPPLGQFNDALSGTFQSQIDDTADNALL